MQVGALPPGLSFWHPAALISTWGGSGLLPGAPGTWGSLFTLPVAWLIASRYGSESLLIAATVAMIAGLWAATRYLRTSQSKDPGSIVIDEVAGQMLTLAFVPVNIWWYLAGFLLFRAADILKPWPASLADRALPGAWGVMTDDVFAALYPMAILYAVHHIYLSG